MADEADRLCKRRGTVIHTINLDELDETPVCIVPPAENDALERDVDLLFGNLERRRKQ